MTGTPIPVDELLLALDVGADVSAILLLLLTWMWGRAQLLSDKK